MSLLTVNLQSSMIRANRKVLARDNAVLSKQAALDGEIAKLIADSKEEGQRMDKAELMSTLGLDYKLAEAAKIEAQTNQWAHLPQDRIFSRAAIKKVCHAYGLRFLLSSHYKGALDEGIAPAIEDLKRANRGSLPLFSGSYGVPSFCIAAPAESFDLKPRPKDPLLFCALGDGRYYLVHKWGNDLSIMRRVTTFVANYRGWFTAATLIAFPFLLRFLSGMDGFQTVFACFFGFLLITFVSTVIAAMIDMQNHPFERLFVSNRSQWDSPFTD